jgi:hypothetical protein
MTERNPMARSAAWTVLLERGFFEGLTGNADSDLTTKFLDDFEASGATRMWEFAETWTPDSPEAGSGYFEPSLAHLPDGTPRVVQAVSHDAALDALNDLEQADREAEL